MGNSAQVSSGDIPQFGKCDGSGPESAGSEQACPSAPSSECVERSSEFLGPACCQCDRRFEDGVKVALELQLPVPRSQHGQATSSLLSPMQGVAEVDKTRYYREWDSIRAALTGGDTRLVRGNFIENTCLSDHRLPRWQAMPQHGYWNAEELLADALDPGRPTPKIVAISYGWLSRDQPDPDNFYLEMLMPLLRIYAHSHRLGLENIALFIDWCSLPQRPWSESDRKAHVRAMRGVDLWYAHLNTDVWLFSSLPEGAVPYEDRGWTRFEVAAASMLSSRAEALLDLGKISSPAKVNSWAEVVNLCAVRRPPPALPDAFAAVLESKSFAFVEDRKVVADKYWGVFHRALGCAERLVYRGLAWGDTEAQLLAAALPRCTGLRELDVSDNRLTSVGATALAAVLADFSALERWRLSNNAIGEETAQQLRSSWALARRPEAGLELDGQSPEDGASAQADAASAQAIASSMAGSNGGQPGGGLLPEESKQALNALLARQAAFEARIESAMAKVAVSVSELSNQVLHDPMVTDQPGAISADPSTPPAPPTPKAFLSASARAPHDVI